jgi:hypothetical protein
MLFHRRIYSVASQLNICRLDRQFLVLAFVICTVARGVLAQSPSQQYQMGTILVVEPHPASVGDTEVARYDVSVKIGNTLYVVLYTPPSGAQSVQYAAGRDMLFLIGKDTLTFVSRISGTTESPILRVEALPPQPILDWSKLPSQYFSLVLQHLSDNLHFGAQQRSQLKHIIEQEAGEVAMVCFTYTLTVQDRVNHWQKIVHSSDEKMKAMLSQTQWQKLEEMRGLEKHEVEQFLMAQMPQKLSHAQK